MIIVFTSVTQIRPSQMFKISLNNTISSENNDCYSVGLADGIVDDISIFCPPFAPLLTHTFHIL